MEVLSLYNSESLSTINLSYYLLTYCLFLLLIIFLLANTPALTVMVLCVCFETSPLLTELFIGV